NARVLDRLPPGAIVVPIQNGFDPHFRLRGALPEGIASFVSECIPERTHTRITRKGDLHLGVHGSKNNGTAVTAGQVIAELAPLLSRSPFFHFEMVPDILPYKHSKLLYNAAISPLAAACGLDNGQLLFVPKLRRLFFGLLRENFQIFHRAGVSLATIGPFHPGTVYQILKLRPLAWSMAWAFYPTLRGTYCSMHGDLPRGR